MLKPLIYNKDIKESGNAFLMQFINAKESTIQQFCKREIDCLNSALKIQYKLKDDLIKFVHIDNGGKSGIQHKIKKKREGTEEGFPDVMIIVSNLDKSKRLTMFLEFKRIGTPSQIHITDKQYYYNKWLSDAGFYARIINNPLLFRTEIIAKIQQFINQ